MLVFDFMTADQFENQNCPTPYRIRRANMFAAFTEKNIKYYNDAAWKDMSSENFTSSEYRKKLLELINNDYKYFQILPCLYEGTDTSKITEILNEQVQKGEEGIMINITDAYYEFKRTDSLLKVKKFKSCDLRIVDMEVGTNKNSDRLGALICEYKNGNTVKVGSGFSYEQRLEFWTNKDKYIGSIVEISYFEETSNANGELSLRFPTFKDIRTDKTEPNF